MKDEPGVTHTGQKDIEAKAVRYFKLLLGFLSVDWIVLARISKETIQVGVNKRNGLFPLIEWELSSFEIQCIRYDFPVPAVP